MSKQIMPKIKESATCPHCNRLIRWTVPSGGDGSAWLFIWHPTEHRGQVCCKGSKTEVSIERVANLAQEK